MGDVKKILPVLLLTTVCILFCASAADDSVKQLDALLKKDWQKNELTPVQSAPDAVFLRRAYLDAAGILPTVAEARAFLRDKSPEKRAKLIEKLINSPEYADMMAMRYSDMYRIKSEFPINLWPNAVQAYHRYFLDNARRDRSYFDVVRELLTSNGSNFRVPAANFFRASANRTPSGLASSAALSLLGMRYENLSEDRQKALAGFFSRIKYKSTNEWKEEIVFCNPEPAVVNAGTPDGIDFVINSPQQDPRKVFADWLLNRDNRYFARAYVNRVWSWFFGRGIVEPVDDMPLPENFWSKIGIASVSGSQPSNSELLDYLADYFVKNNGSTRKLVRLIMSSSAYNADWKTLKAEQTLATQRFAVYPVRRIDSEVFIDILSIAVRNHESYSSVIPEPFTYLPKGTRAVQIADGSISSRMLDSFGRPPRDSGRVSERKRQIDDSQRLFLMNSGWIYTNAERSTRHLLRNRKLTFRNRADEIYLSLLSRYPTKAEYRTIEQYISSLGRKKQWRVWGEVVWALVNSKEFIYQH